MEFEKVLNGVMRYLNNEIYCNMNDWQEVLARIAVSRVVKNGDALKETLLNNSYVKTFGIMDENGIIDIEGLINDLKAQINQKGKLTFELPLFGKFSFTVEDVEKLRNTILGGF
jgi:hypothetical protein